MLSCVPKVLLLHLYIQPHLMIGSSQHSQVSLLKVASYIQALCRGNLQAWVQGCAQGSQQLFTCSGL